MNRKLYLTDIVLISAITVLAFAIAIYGFYYLGYNVNYYLTYKEMIDSSPYGRPEMMYNIAQYAIYSLFLLIIFICFLSVLLASVKQYKKDATLSRVKKVIVFNILPLVGIILGIVCAVHWTPWLAGYIYSLKGSSVKWQEEVGTVLLFLYSFTGIFTAVFGAAVIVLNNILFTEVIDTIRAKLIQWKNRSDEANALRKEQHKAEKIAKLEENLDSSKLAERVAQLEKELEELKRNGK